MLEREGYCTCFAHVLPFCSARCCRLRQLIRRLPYTMCPCAAFRTDNELVLPTAFNGRYTWYVRAHVYVPLSSFLITLAWTRHGYLRSRAELYETCLHTSSPRIKISYINKVQTTHTLVIGMACFFSRVACTTIHPTSELSLSNQKKVSSYRIPLVWGGLQLRWIKKP